MRILIAGPEAGQSEATAEDVRRAHAEWDVTALHGAVARDSVIATDCIDILVWDIALGDVPEVPDTAAGRRIVVACCAPDEAPALPRALAAGAHYSSIRAADSEASLPRALDAILQSRDALHPGHLPPQAEQRLLEVAPALNAGRDAEEIVQLIAHAAREMVSARCAFVAALEEEGQGPEKTYSVDTEGRECAMYDLAPGSIGHRAIESGDVQFEVIDPHQADGIGGLFVAISLVADLRPVGVMILDKPVSEGLAGWELRALRLLAAHAAAAIRSAQLREIAERHRQYMDVVAARAWDEEVRAQAVLDISAAVTQKTELEEMLTDVTRSACTEIGFERARIYLVDHENQMLVGELEAHANGETRRIQEDSVSLQQSEESQLARTVLGVAPYMIDTVEETSAQGLKRYERLFVPMETRGIQTGLITADNPDSGQAISPQQTRLLTSLAGLASVAIERARVEKLRGSLIQSVSHELRAPLASIQAYNELVLTGDAGDINEEQQLYLSHVNRSCRRLERVIADLMNLSKLRAGEATFTHSSTNLLNLVQGVIDSLQPKAKEAGITLHCDAPNQVPRIMTDPGRIEQVLTNLVDNAIKFNEPGGWMRLTLRMDDSQAHIAVADNGPGIPETHQSLIFEEFLHGTDRRSRAKEGAGLGLSIASRVMDVLGGRLEVKSEMNKGTTFHVFIPVA